ncbi:MAG: methylated-DNA--[protein]-cysteine S-methyltransferase [Proteobacteria bacterium]|nr:methylated-DNA--[protein]-cysteine S-methyltransferase [Pseudomonadota bacterium]
MIGRRIDSPVGPLTLRVTDAGARQVKFDGRLPAEVEAGEHPLLDQLERELREYFAGTRTEFTVPLDPVGTEFQLRVWERLRAIPFGQTMSYGELAEAVGSVARAVGGANGSNHLAIVIPCHRVVARDGSLHGFGGGRAVKRWLVDHESPQAGLF